MIDVGSSMVVNTFINARNPMRWLVRSSCEIDLNRSKEHEATPAVEQDVHGGPLSHCDRICQYRRVCDCQRYGYDYL